MEGERGEKERGNGEGRRGGECEKRSKGKGDGREEKVKERGTGEGKRAGGAEARGTVYEKEKGNEKRRGVRRKGERECTYKRKRHSQVSRDNHRN